MNHRRLAAAALIAAAALSGRAFAQDPTPHCMAPAPVTAELVRDATEYGLDAYTGLGAAPSFLLGGLSPMREAAQMGADSGSVAFVRAADGAWRAFLPQPGEAVVGVYAAPSSGAAIIVTMWQTEGPGQSWTLLRSTDGLATADCVTVDFPDTLNQPTWAMEYLDLADLDIAEDGSGEIIGVARTDNRGELWFAYGSQDGGASWSEAEALKGAREARPGLYAPVAEAPAPEALVDDLTRFAAGR